MVCYDVSVDLIGFYCIIELSESLWKLILLCASSELDLIKLTNGHVRLLYGSSLLINIVMESYMKL